MTADEFKVWLDGFAASVTGAPSADQWKAIKSKLATVGNGVPWAGYPTYTWTSCGPIPPSTITCSK